MNKKFERLTAVVDMEAKKYFVLPIYIYQLKVEWPEIVGVGETSEGKNYRFSGAEQWLTF